ncbi:MAG: hypothetical protein MUC65_05815 [Pontiellaceae bacterium]|jgi:predicted transcriptional regulator of viral defense system|nr:hypothetical protein [Pontiellaceae bacterium]
MKFDELLKELGEEPVFRSSFLLTGGRNPADVHRQISRWVSSGKLIQLRRSFYMLADIYRKKTAHPFFLANQIKEASYVSLQSALSYYGLIPEYVPVITSVTTGRPERFETAIGGFLFKHVKKEFFSGYISEKLADGQSAFLATPEKALLDLIYLTPGADNADYLRELRIQHSERLDLERLAQMAAASGSGKLMRTAALLSEVLKQEEYIEL